MTYFEVYDYKDSYYNEIREEFIPGIIYRTKSKNIANMIVDVAISEKQDNDRMPFWVERQQPLMDFKFEEGVSRETILEWYRTERHNIY